MSSATGAVVVVALPARSHAGTSTTSPPTTASPSTAKSPYVTLQPASPSGGLPGDANDGADLWGGAAAVIAIVVAIVLVRVLFRRRGQVVHVAERDDRPDRRRHRDR